MRKEDFADVRDWANAGHCLVANKPATEKEVANVNFSKEIDL